MSEQKTHGSHRTNDPRTGASQSDRKLSCEEWEALLVDYLDGSLAAADGNSFHAHQQSCASCAEMFAHAGQGREWLHFLRVEPQVSPMLLQKILAQTSGAMGLAGPDGQLAPASAIVMPGAQPLPFWRRVGFMGAGRRVAQPRLLMTAAMAFFSITLTLNMAGVRLSQIHLADLKPAALSSNLNKQYHMTSAQVVRYYDNLRIVYEMEVRVRELRRDADLNSAPVDDKQDQPPAPSSPADSNHKSGGKSEGPGSVKPHAMLWGEKVEASAGNRPGELRGFKLTTGVRDSEENPMSSENQAAGQAERGTA